jgi:YD repeat-containing protein
MNDPANVLTWYLTGVTDALSRTTNYEYDDFNLLKKIKYPEVTVGAGRLEENFGYDLVGNLITKTDQAGRVTTFCYDNSHRLTSTIDLRRRRLLTNTTRARK